MKVIVTAYPGSDPLNQTILVGYKFWHPQDDTMRQWGGYFKYADDERQCDMWQLNCDVDAYTKRWERMHARFLKWVRYTPRFLWSLLWRFCFWGWASKLTHD